VVFCLGRSVGVVWCNVVLTFVFGSFGVGGGVFFCCVACCFLTSRPLFQGKDYMHQLEEIINVLGTPSDESLAFITNSMAKRAIMQVCAGGRGGVGAWFLCGGVVVDFFVVLFLFLIFWKNTFFPASQTTTKTVFRIVSGVQ
jgi:serine/threonine protein kinase